MIATLFSRVNIFDVLVHREKQLTGEVDQLEPSAIDQTPEQELVHTFAVKYKFELPVLEDDKSYISHREVNVDVSQDRMRMIWDRSHPFNVKGTEIKISIPFKGDSELFQVRPTTFNLNPPRAEVHGHEIHLTYVRMDNNAAAVKSEYQKAIQDIKQHLDWLEQSIAGFNSNIGPKVKTLISQRRQKLVAKADMFAEIGLPVRETTYHVSGKTTVSTKALTKSISSSKKWDIFISHASEDKDQVARPLAMALRERGISVWYDEFSLKVGDSLRASIDYGLANSRYGVVILSKHFFAKHWPSQELNGLFGKETSGGKVILPVWHDVTAEEVRSFSPMLADRFAAKSDMGQGQLVEQIIEALERD